MTKLTRSFWMAGALLILAVVSVLVWRLHMKTETGFTVHRAPPIRDTFGLTSSNVSGLQTNGR
jgi:hypothetical protein